MDGTLIQIKGFPYLCDTLFFLFVKKLYDLKSPDHRLYVIIFFRHDTLLLLAQSVSYDEMLISFIQLRFYELRYDMSI